MQRTGVQQSLTESRVLRAQKNRGRTEALTFPDFENSPVQSSVISLHGRQDTSMHTCPLYTQPQDLCPPPKTCVTRTKTIWPDAVLDYYPDSPSPFHHTKAALQKPNSDSEMGTLFAFSFLSDSWSKHPSCSKQCQS